MKRFFLVITTIAGFGVYSCAGASPSPKTAPRTGSPVVRSGVTKVLNTTNIVNGQGVTNSVSPITQPGQETSIGQPGSTAIGEPGSTIGQQGTIIGVGLGLRSVAGLARTNGTTTVGQPGRETAIGQAGTTAIGESGIAAIGREGTIIGIGIGVTNRGRLPSSTNESAAPALGQPGREIDIGQQGTTTIGQQGIAAIVQQGTIIGVGLGMANRAVVAPQTDATAPSGLGQPGRETAIGKQGSTAVGEQATPAIGQQGTIIGFGLGGQPGGETAIGQQGSIAIGEQGNAGIIGRQGTIVGFGLQ